MSISAFNKVIQSQIYKRWLEEMSGKNIINTGTKALRSSQEVAQKTDFYISEKDIALMYKTITGKSLEEAGIKVDNILQSLQIGDPDPTIKNAVVGKTIKVEGVNGLFFPQIGFNTITTRLNSAFDNLAGVTEAYKEAEAKFAETELELLKKDPKYKAATKPIERRNMEAKVRKLAQQRASIGFYFNKGHVIGVATNLTKEFKDTLEQAYDKAIANGDKAAEAAKKDILDVLDAYIKKLEQDDLATANLANSSISAELYAEYVKNSSRYLVEMQLRIGNQAAGRDVAPIINELTSVFSGKLSDTALTNILTNSPQLGQALLSSPGSPSMLALITTDIVNAVKGVIAKSKTYTSPKTKVASNTIKITTSKSDNNKKKIAELKKLKQSIKSVQKKPAIIKADISDKSFVPLNLTNLQNLINASLVERVKANMGRGERQDVLNLRTGRFAESVKVERMTESRQGMITAFYSYMKNPYATFSEGGRQSSPKSRDPKLLISRSIREIATTQVANRLRSVNL